MVRTFIALLLVVVISGCASAAEKDRVLAPVVTANPKPIASSTRDVPRLDIKVRGPLTDAQVDEIRAGYAQAFPNSRIYTERDKFGGTVFVITPSK